MNIQIDNRSIAKSVKGDADGLKKDWVQSYSDCSVNTMNTDIVYEVIHEKPRDEEFVSEKEMCRRLKMPPSQFKKTNAPHYVLGGKKVYSFSQTLDYLLAMKPCLVVNENSFKYKTSSDIVVMLANSKTIDTGLQPFERVVLNEYFKYGYTIGQIAHNYSTDSTYIKNVYQYAIRKIKSKL